MSNKKRKLNKEVERLQKDQQQHKTTRRKMLRFIAVLAVLIAITFWLCTAGTNEVLSLTDTIVAAGLSMLTLAAPIYYVVWTSQKIREYDTLIAHANQKVTDWEQRLQEF